MYIQEPQQLYDKLHIFGDLTKLHTALFKRGTSVVDIRRFNCLKVTDVGTL